MSRISQVIFRDNGLDLDQTSQPAKADAYYANRDGRHTLAFYLQNYQGRIYVDATLAQNPTVNDWFEINLKTGTTYVEFTENTSGVCAYTVTGNFYWIRVRTERSYIDTNTYSTVANLGRVDKVLLST